MENWKCWAILLMAVVFFSAEGFRFLSLSHSAYLPSLYEFTINLAVMVLASAEICMPRKFDAFLHSARSVTKLARLVGTCLFATLAYMELKAGPVSISRVVEAALGVIIALTFLFPSTACKRFW